MFLHGPMEKAIPIFFRSFEYRTPRIQERGERRDEGNEFPIRSESF
jgi:hypothetical protein